MTGSQPRVVSLLPGLTDTVLALGAGSQLVGISHECDVPDGWPDLPRLTRSLIDDSVTSAAINQQVSTHQGSDLYALDINTLRELKPDLILTQSQCDVCAISESTVMSAVSQLPGKPRVIAVNPIQLSGVFSMIRQVGDSLARRHQAETVIRQFENIELAIDRHKAACPELSVVHLEWLEPVMGSGHWNPELIRIAGGHERTGLPGEASRILPLSRLENAISRASHVILGACGFNVERTIREINALGAKNSLYNRLRYCSAACYVVDSHRNLVRPGPRLMTSLLIIAKILTGFEMEGREIRMGDLDLSPKAKDFGEIVCVGEQWSLR